MIPARAELQVDCRVPPELGEEHARERIAEVVGDPSIGSSSRRPWSGNRSPIESPLMEEVRGFLSREDPDAELAPMVLPGFTDSRWFRDAFPECVAYGFFPQRAMDAFQAGPLKHGDDERIPVEDLGLAARFYAELPQRLLR